MKENVQPQSELGRQLKEILDNMSQEEFDVAWGKVTALKLKGISFDDALLYLKHLNKNTKILTGDKVLDDLFSGGISPEDITKVTTRKFY